LQFYQHLPGRVTNPWDHTDLSQQTSLQCLSTINMVFRDEDKILINTHKYTQHTQLHAYRN